jgi:hypothetical protein
VTVGVVVGQSMGVAIGEGPDNRDGAKATPPGAEEIDLAQTQE